MSNTENEQRTPVLDPIDRVSEIIFGLIMALTFTGTISAATAGREEVRTVMFAALGCNLAWGMVDAVMYLIRTLTERTRNLTLLRRVRSAASRTTPTRSSPISCPDAWAKPPLRRPGTYPPAPRRPARAPHRGRLRRDDFAAAVGVFLLVVLATFPVVIPFIFITETALQCASRMRSRW